MFGGTEGFAFSKKFTRFDLVTRTWSEVVVANAVAVTAISRLNIVGPEEMYKHLAVVCHQGSMPRLIIFGGENGQRRFETVHEFDFTSKKWTLVNAKNNGLLKARFAHSATIAHGDGKVYIYGGTSVEDEYFDNVLSYDTAARSFERVRVSNDRESMPTGRDFH